MMNDDQLLNILITSALLEDIGDGDYSTLCCIPASARGGAELKIKQSGIVAGIEIAEKIFLIKDASTVFNRHMKDGDRISNGEIAFDVESSIHAILQCERLVLNCMQRMSGIATLTRTYVEKIKGYHTRILDTRKTTPNFRLLEKEAVLIGGGCNHRMGLYDMIMLKDNHIDYAGGLENAIEKAWTYVRSKHLKLKIEVETRNLEEVKRVVSLGKIDRIMLDNFTPEDIRSALEMIDGKFETEASGGINLENIEAYADTGVDYISVGALIHQAQSIDLSLKALIR
jgi:nicotinate-nucleotide pyrophosphorylase (carboxylating)